MAKLLLLPAFLFFHIGTYFCLEFDANGDTVKGATVSLVCTIAPASFTSLISLTKDGSLKTACDNANLCTPASSDAGRYVYSSNSSAVTVTITSLNHTIDVGTWTCSIASESPKDYTLVVQTVPSVVNILQTIPGVNSTEATDEVKVSAECYCIFPTTSVVEIFNSKGTSGTPDKIATVGTGSIIENAGSPLCEPHEFKLEISNYTVQPKIDGSDVYIEIQFGSYKTAKYGPLNIKASPPTPDECQDPFWYGFLPVLIITLVGTLLVIAVSYCVGKESKLQEGSLKQSCGCCPSYNTCCMAVCPLCTNPLCTSSTKTGLVVSTSVTNAAAIAIGLGLGFGLGSGQCTLAAVLSSLLGVVLVAIFTVSVYPHWPCLPEKGEDDSTEPDNPDVIIKPAENPVVTTTPEEGTKSYINCFMPCRVNPSQDTIKTDENNSGKKNPKREPAENRASPNKETPRKTDENNSGKKNPKREPAENQASPNRETPRSPQASASGIQLTTAEGRSPRPLVKLPAIVNESTLNTKEMGTPLPVPPISKKQLAPVQTIQTEDTRDEEETRKKRKKKKKNKKKEGEENGGDDKRDSQNSGGQANVEEEEQK